MSSESVKELYQNYMAKLPSDVVKLLTQSMVYDISVDVSHKGWKGYGWVFNVVVRIPYMEDEDEYCLRSREDTDLQNRTRVEELIRMLRSNEEKWFYCGITVYIYDRYGSRSGSIERCKGQLILDGRKFPHAFELKLADCLEKAITSG